MSPAAKNVVIPLTILIPAFIALMGWQWNLQGRVTKIETQYEYLHEDLRDIKTTINQNYLMNSRALDSIQDDVHNIIKFKKTGR